MTLLTLAPTQDPKTAGTVLDLTAACAANSLGSNTGVSFTNSGKERLLFTLVTGTTTVVVAIGSTIEAEPVTSITENPTFVSGHVYEIGPFNSDEDSQPGNLITVTFGTPANVSGVALLQGVGAQ